jgi:hypothetical protein
MNMLSSIINRVRSGFYIDLKEWSDFTDITNDERNYLLSLFFLTFDYS